MSTQAGDVKRSDAARSFLIQDVLWTIGILAVIFGLHARYRILSVDGKLNAAPAGAERKAMTLSVMRSRRTT